MHGQCLLIYVEFNCQSTTHVKMLLYSIIFTQYFIRLPCLIALSIFVMKCLLKFPYLNYLKILTQRPTVKRGIPEFRRGIPDALFV